MDYSIFKNLAGAQDWFALWPEISLACIALLMLLMDALLPRRLNGLARSAGMLANTLLFVALLMNLVPAGRLPLGSFFGGMIEVTPLGHWFRVFFMLGNLSLFWLAGNYLRERRLVRTEYFVIAKSGHCGHGIVGSESTLRGPLRRS
jgi:NADH-quinone oxidoreductase subunit N